MAETFVIAVMGREGTVSIWWVEARDTTTSYGTQDSLQN
jgi:hypothetical protein